MSPFEIVFLDEPVPRDWQEPGATGVMAKITCDEPGEKFEERLLVGTDFWTPHDYKRQWIAAIKHLVREGDGSKTALITYMYNPSKPKYAGLWWPLYRSGEIVRMHNSGIEKGYLPANIGVKDVADFVPEYSQSGEVVDNIRDIDDDVEPAVSEWEIPLSDLIAFATKLEREISAENKNK